MPINLLPGKIQMQLAGRGRLKGSGLPEIWWWDPNWWDRCFSAALTNCPSPRVSSQIAKLTKIPKAYKGQVCKYLYQMFPTPYS